MDPFDFVGRVEREWQTLYGKTNYLPQRLEPKLYTPGIGHTGAPWPRGTGHDYCWQPNQCISCGCSQTGPGLCHLNQALASGWRPIEGEGTIRELLDSKARWDADMRRISAQVDEGGW